MVLHPCSSATSHRVACRSIALLPLFNASGGYLKDKISSTVLVSVATGVPMIVPRKFLDVYEAFKEEHVIIMVGTAQGSSALPTGRACGVFFAE